MSVIPNLIPYLGKSMKDLCAYPYGKQQEQDQSAHFVSHVMHYERMGALTCKNHNVYFSFKEDKGAMIRVDQLFNACEETHFFANKPAQLSECLVFVTMASNITTNRNNRYRMPKCIQKMHVGLLKSGHVWHYSNLHNKVIADSLKQFQKKYQTAYGLRGGKVVFFYGSLLK